MPGWYFYWSGHNFIYSWIYLHLDATCTINHRFKSSREIFRPNYSERKIGIKKVILDHRHFLSPYITCIALESCKIIYATWKVTTTTTKKKNLLAEISIKQIQLSLYQFLKCKLRIPRKMLFCVNTWGITTCSFIFFYNV